MPGRVTWGHDPLVTDWNGTASNASQSWFNHISQSEATNLMQWTLMGYAGTTTTSAAWDAIFRYFNGGSAGYQSGEKIFIKINMTTSSAENCDDGSYNWTPSSCGSHLGLGRGIAAAHDRPARSTGQRGGRGSA